MNEIIQSLEANATNGKENFCYISETKLNAIKELSKREQQENQSLKRQNEYLRSGEYLNQLKFERNMLEDIVQNGGVSKEDKEFIDMTHRNTELLEENERLTKQLEKKYKKVGTLTSEILYEENQSSKDRIEKAVDTLYCWGEVLDPEFQDKMLNILLKGDKE